MNKRVCSLSGYGLLLGLVLVLCAVDLQAQNVPDNYFAGITLNAPLPAQVHTGETILLKGRIDDPTIPEISFIYSRSSGGGIREFRVLVVDGQFEQRILFGHNEAGEYFLEVWFFPLEGPGKTSIRYPSVLVEQGSGPIEVPPEYYHSLIDKAFFAPNVVSATSDVLPPFYVRAGGQVSAVTVFVQVDGEEERAFAMRDDGLEGDRVAGDGTYTRFDIPLVASGLSLGNVGSLRANAQIIFADGRVSWQTAECGLVAAGEFPLPIRLSMAYTE